VQSLFEHGAIKTTYPKAKEVKAFAEQLITLAKTKGNRLNARRRVIAALQDRRLVDENQDFITEGSKTVIQKLFNDIAPKFEDRRGGYTRIIKTDKWRIGDAGNIVVLELILEDRTPKGTIRRSAGLRRKRNERKYQFAGRALKKAEAKPAEVAAAPASEVPAAS